MKINIRLLALHNGKLINTVGCFTERLGLKVLNLEIKITVSLIQSLEKRLFPT